MSTTQHAAHNNLHRSDGAELTRFAAKASERSEPRCLCMVVHRSRYRRNARQFGCVTFTTHVVSELHENTQKRIYVEIYPFSRIFHFCISIPAVSFHICQSCIVLFRIFSVPRRIIVISASSTIITPRCTQLSVCLYARLFGCNVDVSRPYRSGSMASYHTRVVYSLEPQHRRPGPTKTFLNFKRNRDRVDILFLSETVQRRCSFLGPKISRTFVALPKRTKAPTNVYRM